MPDACNASPARQAILNCLATGPKTSQQLRQATGLPRRSVYGVLKDLRSKGHLAERRSLRDTRQTFVWLKEA